MKLKSSQNKFFVADDDPLFMYKVNKLFSMMDYKVYTADSIGEIAKVLSNKNIEIIFLNIKLLGSSWKQFIKNIKKNSSKSYMIIMTDTSFIDIAAEAVNYGADELMVKPISMKTILTKTEEVLNRVVGS